MKSTALLTPLTQKLDLVVVECKHFIEKKFGNNFDILFNSTTYIHSQKEALNFIEHLGDILILDIELNDLESGFGFIKDLKEVNPYLKIIVYSSKINEDLLLKCIRYSVTGFLYSNSDEYDLKNAIQTSIKRIFLTINNKFNEQFNNELIIKDCLDFLVLKGGEVTFINHHKQVPFKRIANIVEYDENKIILKIDSLQIRTLQKNSHAVLGSMHLGVEIFVTVIDINSSLSQVTVEYTNYIESYLHHRKTPRIAPQTGAHITLIENKIHAFILNISIDHVLCKANSNLCAMRLYTNFVFLINCKMDTPLNSQLNYNIKASGYIKEIISSQDGNKVLIKFEISPDDRDILKNYINLKTVQIIKELKKSINFLRKNI